MVVCDDPFEVKLGDNYEVGVIISYFDWYFNFIYQHIEALPKWLPFLIYFLMIFFFYSNLIL